MEKYKPKSVKGLLETLAEKSFCLYLSDLHDSHRYSWIAKSCSELSAKDYSLAEWQDAIEYLLDEACTFKNVQTAAMYLIARLYQKQAKSERFIDENGEDRAQE